MLNAKDPIYNFIEGFTYLMGLILLIEGIILTNKKNFTKLLLWKNKWSGIKSNITPQALKLGKFNAYSLIIMGIGFFFFGYFFIAKFGATQGY